MGDQDQLGPRATDGNGAAPLPIPNAADVLPESLRETVPLIAVQVVTLGFTLVSTFRLHSFTTVSDELARMLFHGVVVFGFISASLIFTHRDCLAALSEGLGRDVGWNGLGTRGVFNLFMFLDCTGLLVLVYLTGGLSESLYVPQLLAVLVVAFGLRLQRGFLMGLVSATVAGMLGMTIWPLGSQLDSLTPILGRLGVSSLYVGADRFELKPASGWWFFAEVCMYGVSPFVIELMQKRSARS